MNDKKSALKKAIDKKTPEIITLVNNFAKRNYDVITKTRDGKRQFTELIEAAAQACCVDEFKLYIRYKGAKEGTRSLWGGLANPLNAQINELSKTLAKDIANECGENIEIVDLDVLRRFCGYLMWCAHADITTGRPLNNDL